MQYMLLIHTDESAMREARAAAAAKGGAPEMMGAYRTYTEAMKQAGVFVAGDALQPSDTATVVRVRDGHTQLLLGLGVGAVEHAGVAGQRPGAVLAGALPNRARLADHSPSPVILTCQGGHPTPLPGPINLGRVTKKRDGRGAGCRNPAGPGV